MIIPSKIRIGGQDISVVNKERLDYNNLGNICVAEGILQLQGHIEQEKSILL